MLIRGRVVLLVLGYSSVFLFLLFGLLTDLLIFPTCDSGGSELEPWGLAVPSLVVEFLFHII